MTPWFLTCVTGRVELLFVEMGKSAGRASLGGCQEFRFGQVWFEMPMEHASSDKGRCRQGALARRLIWWEGQRYCHSFPGTWRSRFSKKRLKYLEHLGACSMIFAGQADLEFGLWITLIKLSFSKTSCCSSSKYIFTWAPSIGQWKCQNFIVFVWRII